MQQSFIGSIFITGANFAPYGWSFCQGQILDISQNETLYALLGTTYGGDGVQTFGLPDLRGRVPIHQGQQKGTSNYVMGQMGGTEQITLIANQVPPHSHPINVSSAPATASTPTNSLFLAAVLNNGAPETIYSTNAATGTLAASTIGVNTSTSLPFPIVQPLLALNYIISLYGIYPSRN